MDNVAKPDTWAPVRRAILSLSDKRGLVELGQALAGQGVVLIASGGTGIALAEAGLPVVEVAEYTGQPEILGGRVKTLHPRIHGGILAAPQPARRRRHPHRLRHGADRPGGREPVSVRGDGRATGRQL